MPGLYTRLVSGILFPLHERLKGHDSVARRHALEVTQWNDQKRIRADQATRLRNFLVRIGAEVPYYRDLFARLNFDPRGVNSVRSLEALPLLDKVTIRLNAEALKSSALGPLTRYNTGGSSGEPLIFYMDRERKSHDVAAKWRATRWWGVDIGDRELVVWGSPIELGTQDRLRHWRDALMRSHLLPAFEMSAANLDRFIATIRRVRPAMLFGYPSSLSLIAAHAQRLGQRMDDLGIRVAFVTSERLYDEQRQTIADVFGCPVANGYGARDAGFIAHECPEGRLHISAEDIIVETVRPDGSACRDDEAGEIVVTHLATPGFPFVRYRTGDIGTLSDERCPCGRGLPILSDVQGRSTDFVVAADGTIMHGLALIYTVRDLPGIERFKIVQESIGHTEVQIVAGAEFGERQVDRIIRDFQQRLGEQVQVTVRRVNEIPPERSGKFRYVVSKVGRQVSTAGNKHA